MDVPNTFVAGTPIKSAEMNANFASLLPTAGGRTVATLADYLDNNAVYNILDYGAVSPGVDSTNAAAILAAMAAANANGGGMVVVPNLPFNVAGDSLTFNGLSHVLLVGAAPNFNYGNAPTASLFTITTGVWGIRIPPTSSYCGAINIGLVSNGALSQTPPHVITTPGVEYGFLIETGSTLLQGCTAYGFQYGCIGASGLNSNVFEQCTFTWNTKVGFAVTPGTNAAYAAYHPNLTPPASPLANTGYTLRDCKLRRNGWGMIIRDGTPILEGFNVVEANWFGGCALLEGSLDTGCSMQGKIYLEANWLLYDATAAYTVTQNNLWKDTASTWLPWTSAVATATNDAGYQLYAMSDPTHNGVNDGPTYVDLYEPTLVCGSAGATPGKGLYLKQASFWRLFNGSCTGGDQPNAVRVGATGYNVNACHFWDWNGTLPTLSGTGQNRNAAFIRDRTGVGGIVCTQGAFQNVGGTVAGTTGTFSGTLGVTGITSLTGVNKIAGSGAALVGTAAWRFGDTNSGSSRDWVVANGASASGASQIGALTWNVSTALSGDPLAAGTEVFRLTSGGSKTTGSHQATGAFGCNGATPQTAVAGGGAAPAGGTGATAGAYDTAAHRDALITLVNNMYTAMKNFGFMT